VREGDGGDRGPRPGRRGGEMEQTSANPRSGGRDVMWVLGGPFLAWEGELFWLQPVLLREDSRCDCNRMQDCILRVISQYIFLLERRLRESRWLNYSVSSIPGIQF